MLLVALVFDLTALLTINVVIEHPNQWTAKPSSLTLSATFLIMIFAFLSSFFVLVAARAAGELASGQIDIPDNATQEAIPDNETQEKALRDKDASSS